MAKYEFTADYTASPDGIKVVDYKKGDIVEKLSAYTQSALLETGIIVEIKEDGSKVAPAKPITQVDLTDEEKSKLTTEATALLDAGSLTDENYARLKEIGIKLSVTGMLQTKNHDKIVEKIKEAIKYVNADERGASEERKAEILKELNEIDAKETASDEEIVLIEEICKELKVEVDPTDDFKACIAKVKEFFGEAEIPA